MSEDQEVLKPDKPVELQREFSDKLGGAPHSKRSLRLWLKLLSCSMITEKRIRARLDTDFETTLPRFDVLSALERHPEGLTMGQLSRSIMVSNGNITAVVNRLLEDGWVARRADQSDRRVATVCLTRKGRSIFMRMASTHEQWVDQMFQGLSDERIDQLMELLAELRASIETYDI
jgi:DNA-binding MarR family transcriptional regulator